MNQQFRNITYLSDRSGTGQWRRIWPVNSINCIAQNIGVQSDYSQTPILDPNFYKGVNSVTVQRWISDQQTGIFHQLLKPVMDQSGGWLIYEEDDLMFDGTLLNEEKRQYLEEKYGNQLKTVGIPKYNRGRRAFEGKKVQQNIKAMLNNADFVIVTTDYLKEIYHDLYDVPLDHIIALPNLLPKYLFGDRYDPQKKISEFKSLKNKPRIGIVSSLSHFNIDNVREDANGLCVREEKQKDGTSKWINEEGKEVKFEETHKITDDFDDICDCVRSTVNDFQWVCFGYCPPQIKDLADKGKVEVHQGCAIYGYPSKLENLHLQAIVAPIKKIPFNYSKSFIKYMECAAIGVPLFATNCLPYDRVMPKNQLFDTSDDLKQKLLKLKFDSVGIYQKMIENQWKWLNSPCIEGDYKLRSFWLEDNLNIHIDLNKLRPKFRMASMKFIKEQKEKQEKERQEKTIFSNDNGVEILR